MLKAFFVFGPETRSVLHYDRDTDNFFTTTLPCIQEMKDQTESFHGFHTNLCLGLLSFLIRRVELSCYRASDRRAFEGVDGKSIGNMYLRKPERAVVQEELRALKAKYARRKRKFRDTVISPAAEAALGAGDVILHTLIFAQ